MKLRNIENKKEAIADIKYYVEFLHSNMKLLENLPFIDLLVLLGAFESTFVGLRKKLTEKRKKRLEK